MLGEYKNATTAENWDTFIKKGDLKVFFSTWNPCNYKTTKKKLFC